MLWTFPTIAQQSQVNAGICPELLNEWDRGSIPQGGAGLDAMTQHADLILFMCRLKDVTEGACKIPFMKELATGKWYHDSDFLVSYLEDKFPKRKIGKPDTDPQV